MGHICIVTDSSAQFPRADIAAQKKIVIAPLVCQVNGENIHNGKGLPGTCLPDSALRGVFPQLIPPTVDQFKELFIQLGQDYDTIIALFLSSQLNPCVQNAQAAAAVQPGKASIQVIDSQTTSVGLGYLAQVSNELAEAGLSPVEIERKVRYLIPFIYTVFCIPGLSYLFNHNFVDKGQAVVTELLGLVPIFALENGKLTSLEKVRNLKQAMVFLQEFLDEFEQTEHIGFIKAPHITTGDIRLTHDSNNLSNRSIVQEYHLNLPLATLMGPGTISLCVIETPDQKIF